MEHAPDHGPIVFSLLCCVQRAVRPDSRQQRDSVACVQDHAPHLPVDRRLDCLLLGAGTLLLLGLALLPAPDILLQVEGKVTKEYQNVRVRVGVRHISGE